MSHATSEAAGSILWQNVLYGMTVREVGLAQPKAIPSPEENLLQDGSSSDLYIPEFELAARGYSVLFYFKRARLAQVTLKSTSSPTIFDLRTIAEALRSKYGSEFSYHEVIDGFSTAEWSTPNGVNVALACCPEIHCLNINFQMRLAGIAVNL